MASRRAPDPTEQDPLAYALETRRLAAELQNYMFPPWRWPEFHRRRRIVEERLATLRAFQQHVEPADRDSHRGNAS